MSLRLSRFLRESHSLRRNKFGLSPGLSLSIHSHLEADENAPLGFQPFTTKNQESVVDDGPRRLVTDDRSFDSSLPVWGKIEPAGKFQGIALKFSVRQLRRKKRQSLFTQVMDVPRDSPTPGLWLAPTADLLHVD